MVDASQSETAHRDFCKCDRASTGFCVTTLFLRARIQLPGRGSGNSCVYDLMDALSTSVLFFMRNLSTALASGGRTELTLFRLPTGQQHGHVLR